MANQQYASAAELCDQEGLSKHSLTVGSSRVDDALNGTATDLASFGLDEDIAHLIRRAHQRASATFMSVLTKHNLTPAQYFALTRLREKGEVSQNLLGRMAAMDPATIQGVVKRLGDRGLVVRVPDPTDRRRMILSLTEQGLGLIDSLRSDIDELSGKILAPLSDTEQDQLRVLLKRIV